MNKKVNTKKAFMISTVVFDKRILRLTLIKKTLIFVIRYIFDYHIICISNLIFFYEKRIPSKLIKNAHPICESEKSAMI